MFLLSISALVFFQKKKTRYNVRVSAVASEVPKGENSKDRNQLFELSFLPA